MAVSPCSGKKAPPYRAALKLASADDVGDDVPELVDAELADQRLVLVVARLLPPHAVISIVLSGWVGFLLSAA